VGANIGWFFASAKYFYGNLNIIFGKVLFPWALIY